MEHGTPAIKADIEGVERSLITDMGSDVSILKPGIDVATNQQKNLFSPSDWCCNVRNGTVSRVKLIGE